MSGKYNILFLSAEVAPFAKLGGLGDVAGSLPKALKLLGHDVRVVMPAYNQIEAGYPGLEPLNTTLDVPLGVGELRAGVFEGRLPDSDVPIYFIAEGSLFNRPEIYGYGDDPYRFAFYSRAALHLTAQLGWRPGVVHAHDWHAAPAITWLDTAGQGLDWYRGLPTVFTIHNLAHQGKTDWSIFNYLGLYSHALNEEGYNEVNFMARGIYHATMVNTVSATYAREIATQEGGAGMDGLLRYRHFDLHGILNGLDYAVWDPASDPRLDHHFDLDTFVNRRENKRALQERLGLPVRDDIPLLAMVSRLDWQKGLDMMGHAIYLLMMGHCGEAQFVVLGTGSAEYEGMFTRLANQFPEKMTAVLTYSADLAPKIYAGSDIFLMPSLFEPCGLGQLIAMRYGSVPVVRATGGLADTVVDGDTGFAFNTFSIDDFWGAIQRAIYVYNVDPPRWQAMQRRGMSQDYSWKRSALSYQLLYDWAIARMQAGGT